jgi:dihydrolipoamide dehydrogenase
MIPPVGDHCDLIVLAAGTGGYVADCVLSKALLRNAAIASILIHQSATFGIAGDVSLNYARAVSRRRDVTP